MNKTNTWIYCRTASLRDFKRRLDEQEQKLRQCCDTRGWNIVGISRVVVTENCISYELKEKVLPVAQNEGFSRLLTVNLTHISRNPKEFLDFSKKLQNCSVEILDIYGTKVDADFQKLLGLSISHNTRKISNQEPSFIL